MMTLMDLPPHYSGISRVLSAGNSVLFPSVLQSVQVSDPLSVAVVKHALAADELLALATNLHPSAKARPDSPIDECSEPSARSNDQIYRMVCLARIVEFEKVDEGYSMSILGIRRAWIRRQVPTSQPFRLVDLQILTADPLDFLLPMDVETQEGLSNSAKDQLYNRLCQLEFWNRKLRQFLQTRMPLVYSSVDSMQRLLDPHRSLESLTDLATYLLRLPLRFKLQQLQCIDSLERVLRLMQILVRLQRLTQGSARSEEGETVGNIGEALARDLVGGKKSLPLLDGQSKDFEQSVKGLLEDDRSILDRTKVSSSRPPSSKLASSQSSGHLTELAILDWEHKSFPGGNWKQNLNCVEQAECKDSE